jgi:hypothetical protein
MRYWWHWLWCGVPESMRADVWGFRWFCLKCFKGID